MSKSFSKASITPATATFGGLHLLTGVLMLAALAYGVGVAIQRRWVCDDAFISYRYALNLVEGKGLVFNVGERVEGYTNFLWTLWCAVGLWMKLPCEGWSMAWGIACYACALALLAYHSLLLHGATGAKAGFVLPFAMILGALHDDWAVFATSGLETSLFVLLALLGYVLLARGVITGKHRPVACGIAMTLAAMTRPDGLIFAVACGVCLLWFTWPRYRPTLLFAIAFGVPHAIFVAWRIWYYGDVFPNTYYAKSGNLAWWGQGWHYLVLYLEKYGILVLAIPALVLCLARRSPGPDGHSIHRVFFRLSIMAAAFGGLYTLFVTRVGGDFMFARMLIPATPFFLILIELGLARLPLRNLPLRVTLACGIAAALILPPYPMTQQAVLYGIANEWSYYGDYLLREKNSEILKKYLTDLPVCVAFMGSEAHRMYRARIPTAIESEAGLTDRFIAHLPIQERGRIGHEKNAPIEYLISKRKAHFTFHASADEILKLSNHIPLGFIDLDGVTGYILHWDPVIMGELLRRGAKFEDFPTTLDGQINQLDQLSVEDAAEWYRRIRLFYFEHVNDPQREKVFLDRLARGAKQR